MDFFDKVLDYAERLPEGIERARDQIIGMSDISALLLSSLHIIYTRSVGRRS